MNFTFKIMAKNQAAAIAALTFAEVQAMKQPARIERFATEALGAQRAFSAMGKLYRAIESALTKKDKGIFPLLIAAGIKKGTVSNASYAAKVFDLVDDGKLTEKEFDSLSFNDCYQIVRVQKPESKRRLSAEEVVAAIRSGTHFAEDLSSLAEHGITTAEKAAADKAAEKSKKAAEKEAADQAAAEKAELEELRKRNEDLKKAADKAAGTSDPAAEAEETESGEDSDEAVHDEPEADKPKASKDVAAPAAPVQITAKMVLDLLDEVELSMMELSAEDQAIVGTRLVEMADAFVSTGATVTPAGQKTPAKPAKKGKAVASK